MNGEQFVPLLPIRLPDILERPWWGEESDDGDEPVDGDDDEYPTGIVGGPQRRAVGETDPWTVADGDLLVYGDDDLREIATEMYNQLLQRDDLDAQQAEEIADLCYSLHRLDVRDAEVRA